MQIFDSAVIVIGYLNVVRWWHFFIKLVSRPEHDQLFCYPQFTLDLPQGWTFVHCNLIYVLQKMVLIIFSFFSAWKWFVSKLKVCVINTLPNFTSYLSKNLLISYSVVMISEITYCRIVLSPINRSLRTKIVFKHILRNFLLTHTWSHAEEKNVKFQLMYLLKCLIFHIFAVKQTFYFLCF